MAFLPQELGRSQKQPRPHVPANDVTPLIDQQRPVSIRLDPVPKRIPDDRFRRRPNDQRFFQLRPSSMSDDGNFRRKPLHMLGFFLKKTFRNKKREISVQMS